jgi:DNA-binding CsgD family transcriptional regulator
MTELVRSAIDFERGSGAVVPARRETRVGADITDCVRVAFRVRIRARRREPWPARDAETLLAIVHETRQRVGWPEAWLAVVEVDPASAADWAERLADLWPTGRRDTIVRRHGCALLLARNDPEAAYHDLLGVAADYRRLGEPWSAGWALRHAADAGAAARLPRGTLAGAVDGAAEAFRGVGADRSLAELLRAHGDRRALRSVPLPPSQRRRTSPGLTPREEEIAQMAARGLTAALIASRLDLSAGTVRKHLERIKAKLGVQRKHELVELFRSRP